MKKLKKLNSNNLLKTQQSESNRVTNNEIVKNILRLHNNNPNVLSSIIEDNRLGF